MWKKSFPYFLFQVVYLCGLDRLFGVLRLYRRWKTSFSSTPLAEGLPWLTFAAISYMEAHLRSFHRVFEWGGGGSTVFFGCRCGEVVTVDDNPWWLAQLPFLPNVQTFFRRANPVAGYVDYVLALEGFDQKYFDVILVDGSARPDCIEVAPAYLKPGGLLVIDDAERPAYRRAIEGIMGGFQVELSDYGPTPFHPDFKITLILRKRLQE